MSLSDSHTCPSCCGDGGDFDDSSKPCDECDGRGRIAGCASEGCPNSRGYISTFCRDHELTQKRARSALQSRCRA